VTCWRCLAVDDAVTAGATVLMEQDLDLIMEQELTKM
jgi:hypothetical protein